MESFRSPKKGLPMRKTKRVKRQHLSVADRALIHQLRTVKKRTYKQIADETGVHLSTVQRVLKEQPPELPRQPLQVAPIPLPGPRPEYFKTEPNADVKALQDENRRLRLALQALIGVRLEGRPV